jgi:2-methylcitrate dehydratase PrpD
VRELQHRVRVDEADGADRALYSEAKIVSTVQIMTKAGETFTRHVEFPKGEPENAFTTEDHVNKLTRMASWAGLTQSRIERLLDVLNSIEDTALIAELTLPRSICVFVVLPAV